MKSTIAWRLTVIATFLGTSLAASLGQTSQSALAAPYGIVYTRDYLKQLNQEKLLIDVGKSKKGLEYHGGPVIAQAKVYAVMWGGTVDSQIQTGIGGMLTATLNSSYFDMLKEYDTTINTADGRNGTQQHIARGQFAGQITIQPANAKLSITDDEIGAELEHQVQIGALPAPDANTVFMTYFPAGMTIDLGGSLSCQVFCGYHHNYKSAAYGMILYGVHPDLGGNCAFGCGVGNNKFENQTSVTSHELVEVVTDPAVDQNTGPTYPSAWSTTIGEEIGDLCASENTTLTVSDGTTYLLQQAWDNASEQCAAGPFQSP
ncbi:MAG: hypothetical protein P4M08_06385 [Oligoflexia bacterium]|nr:hypothetical protein [Oligoflexia bacterium]